MWHVLTKSMGFPENLTKKLQEKHSKSNVDRSTWIQSNVSTPCASPAETNTETYILLINLPLLGPNPAQAGERGRMQSIRK